MAGFAAVRRGDATLTPVTGNSVPDRKFPRRRLEFNAFHERGQHAPEFFRLQLRAVRIAKQVYRLLAVAAQPQRRRGQEA